MDIQISPSIIKIIISKKIINIERLNLVLIKQIMEPKKKYRMHQKVGKIASFNKKLSRKINDIVGVIVDMPKNFPTVTKRILIMKPQITKYAYLLIMYFIQLPLRSPA